MRIATWNVERLDHKRALKEITNICNSFQADILVLTETDDRLVPEYKFCYKTPTPEPTFYSNQFGDVVYQPTEHRVAIYTNYELVREYGTFNQYTAKCVELKTEVGNLIVYGTIMGVFGNRHKSYKEDLALQVEDFTRLIEVDKPLCIIGDYNMSFSDDYYYMVEERNVLREFSDKYAIRIVTAERSECIDHISLSQSLLDGKKASILESNEDKRYSDHKGIMVEF